MLTTKLVSAAVVGLALVVSPAWRGEAYDNHTSSTSFASDDTQRPRAIRVSRSAPMRTKVIRFAASRYDVKNAKAFVEIIWRESRFKVTATNPSSGAYGLGQANPPTKMSSVGVDWRYNAYTQLAWVAKYISERYDTPVLALEHHNRKGWY